MAGRHRVFPHNPKDIGEIPFWGVPIIRTIVYWGLYWGPLILGNYHILWLPPFPPPQTWTFPTNIHQHNTQQPAATTPPSAEALKGGGGGLMQELKSRDDFHGKSNEK